MDTPTGKTCIISLRQAYECSVRCTSSVGIIDLPRWGEIQEVGEVEL